MKKIVMLVTWFGPWPKWFSLYLESCRWNPTINYIMISDAPVPDGIPDNVKFIKYEFKDYRKFFADRIGVVPKWDTAFKLCDIRPILGYLHEDLVEGYDYWGYGDVDVIFGDIRRFFGEKELTYDVISTHEHIISGHFALIRNTQKMNGLFRKILHWRYLVGAKKNKSFDERIFSMMFIDEKRKKHPIHRLLIPRIGGALLREQYSTSLKGLPWIDGSQNYPTTWFWRSGKLTANNAGDREFLYVHFTHWASKRWTGGSHAIWDGIDPLVRVRGPRPTAFTISATGFSEIV